ncbi:MAG: 4Fe-4S binding protein [Sedimentisphaerales bacterium]|nr:4Fe-4S binding protein [Sedimentisphaerales bacterium]
MVKRNIVKIDEEKCNGCGQCVNACAEGAIKLINGKAKLVSEIYCDGLGACIGHCPQDAITIEQREAEQFDEEATKEHLEKEKKQPIPIDFVCPGIMAKDLKPTSETDTTEEKAVGDVTSQLGHWPVQLKLVSPQAACFKNADLLFVADCVPFAMGNFHAKFLKNRSVVVGCPKLDDAAFYIDKMAEILTSNSVQSLTVIHMEVPCCSGMTNIVRKAIEKNKIAITFEDVTIDLKGNVKNKVIIQN